MNINSFFLVSGIYMDRWIVINTQCIILIIFSPSVPLIGSWDTLQPRSSMLITRVEIARLWWIQCLQLQDISMCLLFIAGWVLMGSWKLCCGGLPAFLAFFGLRVFTFCSLSPLFCYPSSFLMCVCFSTYIFSCSYSWFWWFLVSPWEKKCDRLNEVVMDVYLRRLFLH